MNIDILVNHSEYIPYPPNAEIHVCPKEYVMGQVKIDLFWIVWKMLKIHKFLRPCNKQASLLVLKLVSSTSITGHVK